MASASVSRCVGALCPTGGQSRLGSCDSPRSTLASKRSPRSRFFASHSSAGRCLIPASGYYEWQDTPSGKQPWYFTARDGSPALTIAGLWDRWRDKATGETITSCAMIICEPNKFVAEVHDRMPVLLAEKDFEPWLSGAAGLELLRPAPEDMLQRWPVSKRVNSSKAPDDDPTLIDRIAA
jgi:putative SOS response-associated peptidase YedK